MQVAVHADAIVLLPLHRNDLFDSEATTQSAADYLLAYTTLLALLNRRKVFSRRCCAGRGRG